MIRIICGSVVKMNIDFINVVNTTLSGRGGVDGTTHNTAREAVITPGFNLKS